MADYARTLTPNVPWQRVIAHLIPVRIQMMQNESAWLQTPNALTRLCRWGAGDLIMASERAVRIACGIPEETMK